ncbi:hypothetical protein [Methanosarcina sp. 1.H.T.1A.1]|uniref:hypothetical protein n=1 Tax=Methanosarcina sp. 1.H.T.1A.1 TaxID=1483602 RepID=UPI0012E0A1D4|nr:hypothetical protein [Methanosarcina sp. 1.H.T.1A.1]
MNCLSGFCYIQANLSLSVQELKTNNINEFFGFLFIAHCEYYLFKIFGSIIQSYIIIPSQIPGEEMNNGRENMEERTRKHGRTKLKHGRTKEKTWEN